MSTNKAAERNQKILAELATRTGNDICADCKARNPRWASHNLGIFICVTCASIHRKIGTHVTKVKSITMDTWSKEQVDRMSETGNIKSNILYCPNEVRHPPPPLLMADERDSELEQYIRSKYEYKRFMNKATGSLKPVSSTARSQSTPLEKVDKTLTSLLSSSSSGAARPSTVAIPSGPSLTQSRSFSQTMNPPGSAVQSHHVSLPLTQQHLPARQQSLAQSPSSTALPAKVGLWNDLISLQSPSSNPSLPLQYQQQTAPPFGVSSTPMFTTPLGMNNPNPYSTMNGFPGGPNTMTGNPTGMGMSPMPTGMNFNPNAGFGMPSTNAFQQQSSQGPIQYTFSQGFGSTGFNPMAQQQQTLFPSQSQVQSPQPMFAPQVTQGPGQFNMMGPPGHSPQPVMTLTAPQHPGQFMSPSPQLQQPSQFAQQGFGEPGMGMGGVGYVQQQQQQPQMFAGGNSWQQSQGNFGQTWGQM